MSSKPVILIMTVFSFLLAAVCLYFWWRPEGLPNNYFGVAQEPVLFAVAIVYAGLGTTGLIFFLFEEQKQIKIKGGNK